MKRLWNQGAARESLLGHDTETMNPSIAARSLLGRRRIELARRRLRRRSFHRGNPLPALVGVLGSGILGKIGKAPSESRAKKIAPAIVAAANAGNLTAAAGLIARAAKPMKPAESQVWRLAAAQLAPNIVKAARTYADLIPVADQSNPEHFGDSVLGAPIQLAEIQAQQREQVASAKAETAAGRREAAAVSARREELLGGVATAGLTALARGGRRPTQRRRRRRSYSY